jgi:hypothetical protein
MSSQSIPAGSAIRYGVVVLTALLSVSVASAAKVPAPCSLLTDAQVAKALGYPIQSRSAATQRVAGQSLSLPTCVWSAPPIGYAQTQPSLRVDALAESRARFIKLAAADNLLTSPGFGAPTYVMLNGSIIETWARGVELTFMFQQAATTPKATIALVKDALARV